MHNEFIDFDNMLNENIKACAVTAKDTDLKTLLSGMKVATLKQLAQTLEVANRSKMKKDELIDAIFTSMLNSSEIIKRTLLVCEEDELELLLNLSQGKEVKFEDIFVLLYEGLIEKGYLFIVKDKKEYKAVMPNELKEIFSKVYDKVLQKQRELYQDVLSYICACVNLYGIIPLDKALQIFNHYNNSLEQDKYNLILTELLSQERGFIKEDNYLINAVVLENDKKQHILDKHEKISKYYLPSKETFLNYQNEMYYEKTPQLYALETYLSQNATFKDIEVSDIVDEVASYAMSESTVEDIFNMFDELGVEFNSEEDVKKIGELLTDVVINTRLWINKGFTSKEIYDEMEMCNYDLGEINSQALQNKQISKQRVLNVKHYTEPIRVMKIGRNDPCPCGSGKKYKKCCLGK